MEVVEKPRRITETLLDYWNELATDSQLPDETSVDPDVLGDIWNHCFLVRVEKNDRYDYLYMGDAIIEAYGDDLTGHEVCARVVGELDIPLTRKFAEVVGSRKPLYDEASYVNRKRMEIRYRSCLLPLRGHAGDAVEFILGGMKWKAY